MVGRVVSTKMAKTAVVSVSSTKTHSLYKKAFTSSKRYLVDDPLSCKVGDTVELTRTRPLSKNKHWRVVRVVGRSIKEVVKEQLKEQAEEAIEEVMPEEKQEVSEENQELSKKRSNKKEKEENRKRS